MYYVSYHHVYYYYSIVHYFQIKAAVSYCLFHVFIFPDRFTVYSPKKLRQAWNK